MSCFWVKCLALAIMLALQRISAAILIQFGMYTRVVVMVWQLTQIFRRSYKEHIYSVLELSTL